MKSKPSFDLRIFLVCGRRLFVLLFEEVFRHNLDHIIAILLGYKLLQPHAIWPFRFRFRINDHHIVVLLFLHNQIAFIAHQGAEVLESDHYTRLVISLMPNSWRIYGFFHYQSIIMYDFFNHAFCRIHGHLSLISWFGLNLGQACNFFLFVLLAWIEITRTVWMVCLHFDWIVSWITLKDLFL